MSLNVNRQGMIDRALVAIAKAEHDEGVIAADE